MTLPIIFGVEGLTLSKEEAHFFNDHIPAGLILFKRNCESPEQVKKLVDDFREIAGSALVLIDQEGGRVARLKNHPAWPSFPTGEHFGKLYAEDPEEAFIATEKNSYAIGDMLYELGINVNCAPVLDIRFPETHDAIGDRSFGADKKMVAALADASIQGYLRAGITPVIKHIPGQGRAAVDSHEHLPHVSATHAELQEDFSPFKEIAQKDYAERIFAMVAHVDYTQLDKGVPATQSKKIIQEIIKQEIGFPGIIMSDDITMKALKGNYAERTKRVFDAGCDLVLHCNGNMEEMVEVAKGVHSSL